MATAAQSAFDSVKFARGASPFRKAAGQDAGQLVVVVVDVVGSGVGNAMTRSGLSTHASRVEGRIVMERSGQSGARVEADFWRSEEE